MTNKHLYVFFLFLLLVTSCTKTLHKIEYNELQASDVVEEYNRYLLDIQTFYGEASLSSTTVQNGELESFDISADIAWNERDSFSIKTFATFLSINAFDLFVGKHSYVLKGREQYFRGFNEDAFVQQFTHIQLPLNQWFPFFCGQIRLPETGYTSHLEPDGRLRIVYSNFEVYFRADAVLPDCILFYGPDGTLVKEYKTKDRVEEKGIIFPKIIQFIDKKNKSEILINYSTIRVNDAIKPKQFEVKIPAGMEQFNYEN